MKFKFYSKFKIKNLKFFLKSFSKFLLVLVLITSWLFSGFPQISDFPPKVQVAQAAFPVIADTHSGNSSGNTTSHTVIIDTVIDFYIML